MKPVGKIGLVTGTLEPESAAEVHKCRFVHAVAVNTKKNQQKDINNENKTLK